MWYKFSKLYKIANEYWFHDNTQVDYADGDYGDKNHEMIAEEYILNHFVPNMPDIFDEYGPSKEALNEHASHDWEFLEYLKEKYQYDDADAIDNAYDGNYIRWLMTGDDTAETPLISELFSALKDPRNYVIKHWGWIRVQNRDIETQSLDDNNINTIVHGIQEVYDEQSENMSFNVYVYNVNKIFTNVPFYEIETGNIRKRLKEIEDVPKFTRQKFAPQVPGYKYEGGSKKYSMHIDYQTNKKKRYYHASPVLFKPGDYITPNLPNYEPRFNFSSPNYIFLTSSPKPHYTVAARAAKEGWYIYEVTPTGKVGVGYCWDEYITNKSCIVQKRVGNARGISRSGKPSKNEGEKNEEQWNRDQLKEAKDALKNEELRQAFIDHWGENPEQVIEDMQAKIQYKNPDTSQAVYTRTPPGTFYNKKTPKTTREQLEEILRARKQVEKESKQNPQ